jgi:PhnB protein
LLVVGNAERAIAFYNRVFGAEEVWRVMHWQRVGHAVLRIGCSEIIVLDEFSEADILGPESAEVGRAAPRLLVEIDDVDGVLARAVAHGATLLREAQDQWWGVRAGSIRDPFGYRWNVHSVIEELAEDEIQRRADELGLYPPPRPST